METKPYKITSTDKEAFAYTRIHLSSNKTGPTDYIEVIYNGYKSKLENNYALEFYCKNNVWFETRDIDRIRDFVGFVASMRRRVKIHLLRAGYDYEPERIIRNYIKFLESYHSGFDVRSALTVAQIAERLVSNFHSEYKKHFTFCRAVMDKLYAEPVGYMDNYREFDEYHRLNELYEFGFPNLEILYAEKDHFDKMSDILDEIKSLVDETKDATARMEEE